MANEFIFDIVELDQYLLNYVDILCDNIVLVSENYKQEAYDSTIFQQLLLLRERNVEEKYIPQEACISGYFELVEYTVHMKHRKFPYQISKLLDSLFTACAGTNETKTVDFLVKLADEFNIEFDIHIDFENLFRSSCESGHLEMAKWIFEYGNKINSPININSKQYYAFRYACFNRHLDVMKWLVSIDNEVGASINTDRIGASMFIYCCKNGYLEIAKWLFEYRNKINSPFSIDDREKYAFRHAYFNKHLDVMKWLAYVGDEMGEPINAVLNNEMFINCCINGFLEGVKWLIELAEIRNIPIDIHAKNDEAIISACANGHYELVEWYLELCVRNDSPIKQIIPVLIQASKTENKLEMLENILNYMEISNLTYG